MKENNNITEDDIIKMMNQIWNTGGIMIPTPPPDQLLDGSWRKEIKEKKCSYVNLIKKPSGA